MDQHIFNTIYSVITEKKEPGNLVTEMFNLFLFKGISIDTRLESINETAYYFCKAQNLKVDLSEILNVFEKIGFYDHNDFYIDQSTYSLIINYLLQFNEIISNNPDNVKELKPYKSSIIPDNIKCFCALYNLVCICSNLKKDIQLYISKHTEYKDINISKCNDPLYVIENYMNVSSLIDNYIADELEPLNEDPIQSKQTKSKIVVYDCIEDIVPKSNSLIYPLDKISQSIFDETNKYHKELYKENSEGVNMITNKNGDPNGASLFVKIIQDNFKELEKQGMLKFSKEMNEFDFQVQLAVYNIAKRSKWKIIYISYYDIYKTAFGISSNISSDMYKKLEESIDRMFYTTIEIDNRKEIDCNYKYPRFYYKASVFPVAKLKAVNDKGKEISVIQVSYNIAKDGSIHVNLPLFNFAEGRNQLTAFPADINQLSFRRDERVLKIENRIKFRIAQKHERILESDLFQHAGITRGSANQNTLKSRRRAARISIDNLLGEYKKKGIIIDYKLEKNNNQERVYVLKYKSFNQSKKARKKKSEC